MGCTGRLHAQPGVGADEQTKNEPCIHVEAVELIGNDAISTARLKMRMKSWHSSLLFGNLNCFNEKWLRKDIDSLVTLYREKGFPDVDIRYRLFDDEERFKKALKVETTFQGDTDQEDEGGNNRLQSQTDQKDDEAKNFDQLPDQNGGQKGSLNAKRSGLDANATRLYIAVDIREGLQYRIAFQGNNYFSERELSKNIDLVSRGNVRDAALKKGKIAIRQHYLDAGFQDVTVDFEKTKGALDQETGGEQTDLWHVLYTINEGEQSVVNALTIVGNAHVEENEILAVMLTREKGLMESGGFNTKVLQKDLDAIELLYLSKGFLDVKVTEKITGADASLENETHLSQEKSVSKSETTPKSEVSPNDISIKKGQAQATGRTHGTKENEVNEGEDGVGINALNIAITINEGPQTLVGAAKITGLSGIISMDEALSKLSLREGEPFREYMITSDENLLGMLISEKGYPHVKVKGEANLDEKRGVANVIWHVDPGPFTIFGSIRYKGNQRLQKDIIRERLTMTPGDPFSLRQVLLSERQVRESSAVKSVRINAPGLKAMEAAPDLEVVVEENLPYFVEAAMGYDTAQTFYLDTRIGDNNFLGREIDAWVGAKVSGIGYRLESGLAKPYFWGTPIHASCNLYLEDQEELNQDFGTRSFGGEAKFSRSLWIKGMSAAVNFKYENRKTYGDVDLDEQETRNILITSGSLGYDTRDSSVRPTKGMLSTATLDLFTGFDNELDRFLKYKVDFRKYLSPMNHLVLALRTRIGYIQPFGAEDRVAEDQLFFLGGTSDVRGFDENMLNFDLNNDPVGGQTSINATLEARIDLPANFELNCFVDSGRIDEIDPNLDPKSALDAGEFRSSVGVGLRYITPIGPVGILYGHKLNPEEGEDSGRIHLSVGYTF